MPSGYLGPRTSSAPGPGTRRAGAGPAARARLIGQCRTPVNQVFTAAVIELHGDRSAFAANCRNRGVPGSLDPGLVHLRRLGAACRPER
jgi:hypothetical protein